MRLRDKIKNEILTSTLCKNAFVLKNATATNEANATATNMKIIAERKKKHKTEYLKFIH